MPRETQFTMDTSSIVFGPGSTHDVGAYMKRLGTSRVMVVTDARLAQMEPVANAVDSLKRHGLDVVLYDRARVEPTDESMKDAIAAAIDAEVDGYVAVGGGSSMDTAKAANLYATWPADFLAYVNAPIGRAEPVPGPVKPLIAIPTTAGTGSETTGVTIFDLVEMHAKTGIAHRALRPTMGILDSDNTRTMPRLVACSAGFDVLSHAVESLTALPYSEREAPERPELRPAYQGANPISDIWAVKAIEMMARSIVPAIENPDDDDARGQMLLAAAYAGIGFGNAGVHLPHGMSYPVSGMVSDFQPEGYDVGHAIVPHGMSVILNAPSVFRWTSEANPERHLMAAELMGADVSDVAQEDAGEALAGAIIELMKRTGMPSGLAEVGFGDQDINALVEGTLPQHRVTKLSPRPADRDDLRSLFHGAMKYW